MIVCATLYNCFFCLYMQQEIQGMSQLCISILWCRSFLNLYSKLSSLFLLTIKSQFYFISYIDVALDLPKQLQCLVDKTLSCLENIYLKVVTHSSSMKKVFLQNSQDNTCADVFFLIKLLVGGLQLYKKAPRHRCCPVNFVKFSRTPILWSTCKRLLLYIVRLIYDIYLEKSLLVPDLLLSHLI